MEKLTPEKDTIDEAMRIDILQNLAESLMLHGDYHLATKKFTQAGDKVMRVSDIQKMLRLTIPSTRELGQLITYKEFCY